MPQLLLELLSEEIPAGMQLRAANDLKSQIEARLTECNMSCASVETFVTPRRLVLVAEGLPTRLKDSKTEKRGPRVGAPQRAIDGFIKSVGLNQEQLEKRKLDKGEFYFAVSQQKGRLVSDALSEILQEVICGFRWPKSMKWNQYGIRWVRPLHSILCVFNGKVLAVNFGHLKSSNVTSGHRFLAPKTFNVNDFEEYKAKLAKASVVLDSQERMKIIHDQADLKAKGYSLLVKKDEKLLEEVSGLVEWPEVLVGKIEERFLGLPQEVLITAMRSHQKYFSMYAQNGKLAPYFVMVSNIKSKDGGKKIIHGNERVLKARLEDAKFFWDQDRRESLESRLPNLKKIIFHAKLGTLAAKTERVQALAKLFAVWVPHASLLLVERAAMLCKLDLTTQMVWEFPELQGVMGYYYALEAKEDAHVANAIKEHYSPIGPNDMCPVAPVSVAVSLADKIDTLVGLFAIDEKPTGSKDPYALRRAALGVIRIIIENNLHVPLRLLFEKSISRYPKALVKKNKKESSRLSYLGRSKKRISPHNQVIEDLLSFFVDRLRVLLRDQDIRYDLIEAVFDDGGEDDLNRLVAKVRALEVFLQTDDGENLCAAYKRANNILVSEERKDGKSYIGSPNSELLKEKEELELFDKFKKVEPNVQKYLKKEDFERVMVELATLRSSIDHFFERVTVNASNESTRKNRLLLLSQFRAAFNQVANFSKIDG